MKFLLVTVAFACAVSSTPISERHQADNAAGLLRRLETPPPPPVAIAPRNKGITQSLERSDDADILLLSVTIGASDKKFRMFVDTGSDVTWIRDKFYEKSDSSKEGETKRIRYSDGTRVQMKLYTDVIHIGNELVIKEFEIGVAEPFHDRIFKEDSYDGMIGLGPNSPVLDGLVKDNSDKVPKLAFGLFCGDSPVINWGFHDPDLYEGELYMSTTFMKEDDKVWHFTPSVAYEQREPTPVLRHIYAGLRVAVDSGTGSISLPKTVIGKLQEYIGKKDFKFDDAQGKAKIERSLLEKPQQIRFTENGEYFIVDMRTLELSGGSGRWKYLSLTDESTDGYTAILGTPFLDNYYFYGDKANLKMGLAIAKD